jgi:DNA-directed RNA polymerase subunit RPC12/RpoP
MTKYPVEAKVPCQRCGGKLLKPVPDAQYECQGCGAVVAPEFVE